MTSFRSNSLTLFNPNARVVFTACARLSFCTRPDLHLPLAYWLELRQQWLALFLWSRRQITAAATLHAAWPARRGPRPGGGWDILEMWRDENLLGPTSPSGRRQIGRSWSMSSFSFLFRNCSEMQQFLQPSWRHHMRLHNQPGCHKALADSVPCPRALGLPALVHLGSLSPASLLYPSPTPFSRITPLSEVLANKHMPQGLLSREPGPTEWEPRLALESRPSGTLWQWWVRGDNPPHVVASRLLKPLSEVKEDKGEVEVKCADIISLRHSIRFEAINIRTVMCGNHFWRLWKPCKKTIGAILSLSLKARVFPR